MVFCKVLMAIPLVYTSLLSSSMFRLVQSVFIDQSSSYSSLNGCGWLLDDSTSGAGIHVIASYLLRRGGAKISVPHSVEFRNPFQTPASIDLIDTDESDDDSSILSLIGHLRSEFKGLQ